MMGRRHGRWMLALFLMLAANFASAAQQCTAVFSGGIQSHSSSGVIQMGYMSRVYGSGNVLTAPSVTHFSEYQDQAGLCDGVKCSASGTTSATSDVTVLTGTEVPATFLTSSAANGNVANGYQAGTLTKPAGEYGTVSVGQQSTIRFSSNAPGSTYRMKNTSTNYQSTLELEAGSYWIDGNLRLEEQTVLRRIGSGNAPVVLYVSGTVEAKKIKLEGFAEGQILLYAGGSVNFGNELVFPGRIHSRSSVNLGQSAVVTGGVYGTLGSANAATIRYTRVGYDHLIGAFAGGDRFNATYEMAPGNYHFNGDLSFAEQTRIRKLTGTTGKVRLFVNGNINVDYQAKFEGFGAGELLIYATGNIKITSQTDMPVFVYAKQDVTIAFSNGARFQGGIAGRNVYVGQNSIVQYTAPSDLGPACSDAPAQVCLTDNFNRTDLGSNWSVAYSSGSFGNPRITNNRLRLTDNAAYNATAATFLMTTPGAGNKITTTFKYYAYGGNNADGVVLTFSDANVTPQPGGYGGSLGYATVSGNNKGFAGGWLGVALDEYGNFSNPTETRKGGPGFTPQAVVIRGSGSGSTGYNYLQGTKTLSPKLDQSGSAAGPGHTYRVTLDTTTAGKALVTVERDTGSGFTPVITSFDALASSSQAAVPTNFYLTFTSSTGGQNNNHEIDDFQVCANKFNEATYPIDHFEFQYSDNALTCTPLPVKIRACVDAACSVEYSKQVTVTLSPANFWVGGTGRTVTFTGNAALQFRNPDVNTKAIGVESSSVQTRPVSQPVCSTAKCEITFHDSGFIFDVPNMVAGKTVTVSAQAVRKDKETQSCAPALSGPRDVRFYGIYDQPATGTKAISIDGSAITMVSNGTSAPSENARTKVQLTFDDQAKTSFPVTYPDAGKMALSMSYFGKDATGDSYLQIGERSGDGGHSRDLFVSKPYGLCLQTAATCSKANVDDCAAFPNVRAGDPFDLMIKAVAWTKDGQSLTAPDLCSNPVTPNFQLDKIQLAPTLNAPANGIPGTLGAESYAHALGDTTTVSESLSEVGVFSITATPPVSGYFSETVSASTSAMIGRMTPAYLDVSGSGTLDASCNSFSYQGQAMAFSSDPTLTVTGKNRQGKTTQNYDRGNFWRMDVPPTAKDPYSSATGFTSLDKAGRLAVSNLSEWTAASDATKGDGQRSYRRTGELLTYAQAISPSLEDLPFKAEATFANPATSLTDKDGVCYSLPGSTNVCSAYNLPITGKTVQLGRLSIGNASGSELQGLDLPWQVESWQSAGAGGVFAINLGDTCSLPALGTPSLANAQGHLSADKTSASLVSATSQKGVIRLTAPGRGNDGSIQTSLPVLSTSLTWLRFDWRGVGLLEPAAGLATFGIYSGSPPLIFRREVYR